MNLQGIHLSWIVVKDLNAALKFYTEVVGLTLMNRSENYGWAELSGPGGAVLGIAEESSEMETKAGENAIITISVVDIDQARRDFVKKGAKLLGEVIEVPGHVKMQTFQDVDGNTMQLCQVLAE